ncbi:MAG: enoyl-CoA hydratase/isomerase family protein [Dehalococcoidia bacterium]|nr:enoyl-CoA hydratase/isomerase family protein [Dehalococcoidia bacterium]
MRPFAPQATGKAPAVVDVPAVPSREAIDALMRDLKTAEEELRVGAVVLVFPPFGDGVPALALDALFPAVAGLPDDAARHERLEEWNRRLEYLRNLYVPVVAAVDGECSGWALELALAADVVVCSEDACFAVAGCPAGIPYQLGVALGTQRLKRLTMFGERLDGTTAVAWGLANHAVAGTSFGRAMELGSALALPPRDAMSVLKESLNAIDEHRAGPARLWVLGD